MATLNEILKYATVQSKTILEDRRVKVHYNYDQNMPEIYDDAFDNPIFDALSQLSLEVEDAHPKNVSYTTKLENNLQKVILMHDGKSIPESILQEVNAGLKAISTGEKIHESGRHGNLIAAQAIKEFNGRIYIENISEGAYGVRTTLELPVKILE